MGQREWSKPYMCTNFALTAPAGHAVRLAISYLPWDGAHIFYKLQHALEHAMPGAQIVGDADFELKSQERASLRVLRLNDNRVLLHLGDGEADEALRPDIFEQLVNNALDNFSWRYGGSDIVGVDGTDW